MKTASITVGLVALAAEPQLVLSLVATVTIFSMIGMAGAWLVDRYSTSLPGRRDPNVRT